MAKTKAKWIDFNANTLKDTSGALDVFLHAGSGLESTAAGIRIKAGEVTDSMLAGSIAFSKLADSDNIARLDQAETVAAVWNFGSNLPTASADPTGANQLVRKAYVDAVASGLSVKDPTRVATTGVLHGSPVYSNGAAGVGATLTGSTFASINTPGIDGITNLTVGHTILVKNQGSQFQNGIYEVTVVGNDVDTNYILTRLNPYDQAAEVTDGSFFFVEEGTTLAGSGFVQTEAVTTMGTSPIAFSQFSGAGQITAGNGMSKTGNTLDVVPADLITGGDAQIDGDKLNITYVPTNYTRAIPAEAGALVDLSSHLKGIDDEIALAGRSIKEMHKVTAGEVTAGFFTLTQVPTSASLVSVTPVYGPQQVNKQIVGATGVTPDFDVLDGDDLHFNNNGTATGLSAVITTDDVLIIEYVY